MRSGALAASTADLESIVGLNGHATCSIDSRFFASVALSALPEAFAESSACVFERASCAEIGSICGLCVYWA